MKRGEIWTLAGGGDYTGRPRPAVIVQDDRFDTVQSVTACPFTTDGREVFVLRIPVEPDDLNGLDAPSYIMVDKITTVRRSGFRAFVGRLDEQDMLRLNRAIIVFLGLAG